MNSSCILKISFDNFTAGIPYCPLFWTARNSCFYIIKAIYARYTSLYCQCLLCIPNICNALLSCIHSKITKNPLSITVSDTQGI